MTHPRSVDLTLASLLERVGGPAPPRIAGALIAQVLHALHAKHCALHPKGAPSTAWIHGNVNPHGVIVENDGSVRLVDFGPLARLDGRPEEETRPRRLRVELGYLSPEQIQGYAIDHRTDLYAAAVLLWEMLSGRRLFEGEDDEGLAQRIPRRPLPKASLFNPTVSRSLDEIVLRALAKEPAGRYASAREMAAALAESQGLVSAQELRAWVSRVRRAVPAASSESSRDATAGSPPKVDRARAAPAANEVSGPPPWRARAWPVPRTARTVAWLALAMALVSALSWGAGRRILRRSSGTTAATDLSRRSPPRAGDIRPELTLLRFIPDPIDEGAAPRQCPRRIRRGATSGGGSSAGPGAHGTHRVGRRRAGTCHPPFTIDSAGIKRFKTSCLTAG